LPTYNLEFLPSALKEWQKLGATVRDQFKKKLEERLKSPAVRAAQLRGAPDLYKIKLRASGYRLVYRIDDDRLIVVVIAVGKRDKSSVYRKIAGRGGPD
jgi:mRNA interferase RelE/StbE